jgi:hypothetical protein
LRVFDNGLAKGIFGLRTEEVKVGYFGFKWHRIEFNDGLL